MQKLPACSVLLLRPSGTGCEDFGRQVANEQDEIHSEAPVYNEHVDNWLEYYRQRLEDIAEEAGVQIHLRERQLFTADTAPGAKFRRTLPEFDVVTTVDPSKELQACITNNVLNTPMQRAILAYSSREALEQAFDILQTMKTKLMTVVTEDTEEGPIQRCAMQDVPSGYAFYYEAEDQMQTAVHRALVYPDQ